MTEQFAMRKLTAALLVLGCSVLPGQPGCLNEAKPVRNLSFTSRSSFVLSLRVVFAEEAPAHG